MKKVKFLRVLAIGVIASVLAIAIPASPVLAAEEITLDPEEGEVGTEVEVDGEGFDESDFGEPEVLVYVSLYLSPDEADEGDEIGDEVDTYRRVKSGILIDGTGDFDDVETFTVPSALTAGTDDEDVTTGLYYVYVTYGDDEIVTFAEFQIIGGEIEVNPDTGNVGDEVDITGTDFMEDEELTVEFDGSEVDIESGDDQADNDGEFTLTFLVPEETVGDHTVTVTGDEGSEAEATFEIEPALSVNPTTAPPGDTVTVSGTGFGDRLEVDITLCGVDFPAAADTGRDGSFSAQLEVPEVDEGIYDIDAEDEDGNDASVQFTVEEAIEIAVTPVTSTASPGYVGQNITVSGAAFQPNAQVTITYTSTPQTVATTTSDGNGNFTATFSVPESEAGSHTITASDGTNSLQVPFYMEGQAPDIPPPLLPLMGDRADALTEFDWEDVEDVSGVTYTLQVATSDDFAPASIVLVKDGLTASEYKITEAEKLPSRSKEEPYYWRVKAVDGAGNESGWTGVGQFYMGFSLPPWTVHLWWGLGVLGAGLGFYWLGKRRAYYY